MDNEMAIDTYLSTTESKKQTKQTRRADRITDAKGVLMVARCKGGVGEQVKR